MNVERAAAASPQDPDLPAELARLRAENARLQAQLAAALAEHDAWSPYFGYACDHALCNAHHLRELTYLVEREGQAWAAALIALLVRAHDQVEQARTAGAGELDAVTTGAIAGEYRRLVAAGWAANPLPAAEPSAPAGERRRGRPAQSKARNLLARLERYERETLAFISDFAVPFDNNQAQRDLRMLKVQQKISGGFRSEEGRTASAVSGGMYPRCASRPNGC